VFRLGAALALGLLELAMLHPPAAMTPVRIAPSAGPALTLEGLSPALLVNLYRTMALIRKTEEKIVVLYPEQEMRCPTHLSIGQEATATGVCATLGPADAMFSGHRCHAHYLAKGGDLKRMMAELYGRATGCAGGKGGSMHLVDLTVGAMGASAVVAGSIPLAVGAALAARMQQREAVAVAFFGDGAVEEGAFHESVSFAALHRLPVVFACENNFYATYSPMTSRQVADNIFARAEPFGMPGVRVDGNDVAAVYRAAADAVRRARAGAGPALLELRTYRWRDHVGPAYDVAVGYRTQAELDAWMARDPVATFALALARAGVLSEAARLAIEGEIDAAVDEAVAFAKASPYPEPSELTTHVYG
jgi:acetoin:2,6-dichlorophenolindophenol oxidoreductase subunit alpha